VIANAGGGMALYGLYSFDKGRTERQPPKKMLQKPAQTRIVPPAHASTSYEELEVSTSTSGSNLIQELRSRGLNLAMTGSLSSSLLSCFHIGGGLQNSSEHSTLRESTRCSSAMVRVSVRIVIGGTFQIPLQEMRLTEDCRKAALSIKTLKDAQLFLHHFGTHIFCGRQTLGGSLIEATVAQSTRHEGHAEDVDTGTIDIETGVGVAGPVLGGIGVRSKMFASKGRKEDHSRTVEQANVGTRAFSIGPRTLDLKEWQHEVANNRNWSLLGCEPDEEAFVPVWEVLLRNLDATPELEATVKLLKQAAKDFHSQSDSSEPYESSSDEESLSSDEREDLENVRDETRATGIAYLLAGTKAADWLKRAKYSISDRETLTKTDSSQALLADKAKMKALFQVESSPHVII